ncbi:hypothetical protein [uncultured Duncaniella sp.]|uniref:hypothetical protein n=1 Tax=uncultured Duncaniella sp. TaxID=2768039 RepID=UPI00265F7275|nr:hypothetical protein [uncultured Duncaniella sp.]
MYPTLTQRVPPLTTAGTYTTTACAYTPRRGETWETPPGDAERAARGSDVWGRRLHPL